jgi:alkanesulfonate monooxygenase SsuD/methylene tetrahydromethanopterin reductase-like flavin-dependent oxidoreductase (luciferase family)
LKIGIYDEAPSREQGRRSAARLERLALAEAQGYDAIWLADGAAPDAGGAHGLYFELGQLAALTTRVELGLHAGVPRGLHPLRVAEDLAVLDIMSSGRLSWAVRGPGPDPAALLLEQLAVIRDAWSGDAFAHEGEHMSFPELSCHPRPARDPHPPLWLDASWEDEGPPDLAGRFWHTEHSPEHVERPSAAPLVAVFRLRAGVEEADALLLVERLRPEAVLLLVDAAEEGEEGEEEAGLRQGKALEALKAGLGD